ncbi:hypothetical protein [Dokdonella fugitiva]|jgi:hypothetical protein|uniref:DUF3619 family protein n=1 Tax=Dokdonella fugitiva TaxID=328517 RepID=A0A4R2ID12_9GAMM|nr:hypothetical protein [Dokdonella fugitiva]MBA8883676.1 hypothetical protein [Dokdonella fugitiva]TCO41418.1 hypothetical protein EV148_103338 [Dokdonella fugitiva]
MNTPPREPWLDRSLALLDQSAESLDAATLSRLNRARQAALVQPTLRHWRVGLALAGTAALALMIGIGHRALAPATRMPPEHVTGQATALDVLADDDGLELSEDLDFYAWFDAEQDDVDG